MFSYNPGVRDMSGQLLAQGISQAFQGASAGLQEYRKKQELKQQDEAAMTYLMQNGLVKSEAEAKAAVKGMGGGPRAVQAITAVEGLKAQQAAEAQAQEQARLAALREQEQAAARMAAMGPVSERQPGWSIRGQAPTTRERDPYQDEAVRNYIMATGGQAPDPQTLAAMKMLPGRPEAGAGSTNLNFVEDPVTGERFAVGDKGNFSRSGTNPARATPPQPTPQSSPGKLLADADELAAQGRTAEAEALRAQALRGGDPRLTETQTFLLDRRRQRVTSLYDELDEIDAEIRDKGPGGMFSKRDKKREEVVKKIAAAEGELERTIASLREPLKPNVPARAEAGGAAAAPANQAGAQQFKKGDRVRQGGKVYEYDGTQWNVVG
jgi:hypothetical protein